MKPFQFEVPIYNRWIGVLVMPTYSEIEAFFKKHFKDFIPDPNLVGFGHTFIGPKYEIVIVFNRPTPDIICHESFHAAQAVFQSVGINSITMAEAEEQFAYLQQFIFDKIFKVVNK